MASSRIGVLTFRCNICGTLCESKMTDLGRETPSCAKCGSTVRMRAVIHLLSSELFGKSISLPNFPIRRDIRGIGLSDWDGYAVPLARKLSYKNTFYHKEPLLDITAIDPALEGKFDFLIATDVFEHIIPPVSVAFVNARRLLKPNGVLIFSVPYKMEGETEEHFPDLFQYVIIEQNGNRILENRTRDGRMQHLDHPTFHGGAGSTLEMRLFSESALKEHLTRAGFQLVTFHQTPNFEHGIYWQYPWSLPMTARYAWRWIWNDSP